uniref:Uncharacterized protein n=1 Tax=Anguilla anguilla TaxID=7936 RepID=A0A0E9QIT6_ANGAN
MCFFGFLSLWFYLSWPLCLFPEFCIQFFVHIYPLSFFS